MLYEMTVENIALLERVTVSFHAGLNVLTGETGAGKSMLVDALLLLLGGRGDRELIRSGADKAVVEGAFAMEKPALNAFLSEQGIDAQEELFLSREYNDQGRSVCRVNGRMVPLTVLREIGGMLVDIHGQHEHQTLLDPKVHLSFLDGFAGLEAKVAAYHDAYATWRRCERDIAEMAADPEERARRMDILSFQMEEISKARIKPGEEDTLLRDRALLLHEQRIGEILDDAYQALYVGNRDGSALDMLSAGMKSFAEIAELDPAFAQLHTQLSDMYYQLEDITTQLRDVRSRRESEPQDIERMEARLETIADMKRKYGRSEEAVVAFFDQAQQEFTQLEGSEGAAAALQAASEQALQGVHTAGTVLSKARLQAGKRLETAVTAELSQLGMAKTQFAVAFETIAPNEHGLEHVSFHIAPNPGEPLRPLHKTASGGELSRIMLALKTLAADDVDCLVFDEVDTGISGRTAAAVADKMAVIASQRQVLCITHLPQIAAMADQHFLIEKQVDHQRTHTQVTALDAPGSERVLAQMAGGTESEAALLHAHEMRISAEERKQVLRGAGNE